MWPEDEKRLALAADASTLSDRFTVLVISVVTRGCGIPIAWKIVEATKPGSWKPHWQELFSHISAHCTSVLVCDCYHVPLDFTPTGCTKKFNLLVGIRLCGLIKLDSSKLMELSLGNL